jgi:hypothetical protein
MIAPPLAHAGHWLVSLLYLVPVLLVVGALVWQSWRDRRRRARGAEGGPPSDLRA